MSTSCDLELVAPMAAWPNCSLAPMALELVASELHRRHTWSAFLSAEAALFSVSVVASASSVSSLALTSELRWRTHLLLHAPLALPLLLSTVALLHLCPPSRPLPIASFSR